jgi:hypothetical protein
MTNCKEFCQVFLELGVPHVISFEVEDKNIEKDDRCHLIDNDKDKAVLSNELKLFRVLEYMRCFSLNLYPAFLEDQTVFKAI